MKILKFKNKQKFKFNKKVIVKDLILLISVGIHQFEKQKKQKVKFNLVITTDPNLKSDIKNCLCCFKAFIFRIRNKNTFT